MKIFTPNQHWFISDLHLGHNNLRSYESEHRSDEACGGQPFEDMIAWNWDRTVSSHHIVWVLGDVVWGRKNQFADWLRQRPGEKHLVRGNHDKGITTGWFKRWGFQSVIPLHKVITVERCAFPTPRRPRILLSHYPVKGGGIRYPNQIRECREEFWSKGCNLNIHGHTHGHGLDDPALFDVSCEAVGMCPINLEDILCLKMG